jgi:hypothetical protein
MVAALPQHSAVRLRLTGSEFSKSAARLSLAAFFIKEATESQRLSARCGGKAAK